MGTNGANPAAGLIQAEDGDLYGTTVNGGANGVGTVFKMSLGGGLTTLVSFGITNGAGPYGNLIQGSDGNFYGTTSYGGLGGGSIFQMTPAGNIEVVREFSATGDNGYSPQSGLLEGSDGDLLGTTSFGGASNKGTVFRFVDVVLRPPKLYVQQDATSITLQWTANYTTFSLQTATALINSNSWTNVLGTPSIVGSNYSLTILTTNVSQFFRLRSL